MASFSTPCSTRKSWMSANDRFCSKALTTSKPRISCLKAFPPMERDTKKHFRTAVACFFGLLLCCIVISIVARQQRKSASVPGGPVLASTAPRPQFTMDGGKIVTHQIMVLPSASEEEPRLPGSRSSRNVDLIDFRFNPLDTPDKVEPLSFNPFLRPFDPIRGPSHLDLNGDPLRVD